MKGGPYKKLLLRIARLLQLDLRGRVTAGDVNKIEPWSLRVSLLEGLMEVALVCTEGFRLTPQDLVKQNKKRLALP